MEVLQALPKAMSLAGKVPEALLQKKPDQKSIDKAANEFEAAFVSMLFKEMRQTLEEGSLFAGDSSDVLGGLFDQFLGQQLAKSGSLGIAGMVKKELEAAYKNNVDPIKSGTNDGLAVQLKGPGIAADSQG